MSSSRVVLISLLGLVLVFPLLCSAVLSERRILLQGHVIDTTSTFDDDSQQQRRRVLDQGQRSEYIVQLQPPVDSKKIKEVERDTHVHFAQGIRIPHHSLLVIANEEQASALESHPSVLWVGDFDAHFKYPASLRTWQQQHPSKSMTAELIVVLHSVANVKAAEQLLANWAKQIKTAEGFDMTVKPVKRTDRVHVLVPASKFFVAVQWLAKQVGTLWIEPALEQRSFANKATGIVENGVAQSSSVISSKGIDGGGAKFEIISLADSGLDWSNCFFNQTSAPTPTFNFANKIVAYDVDGGDTTDPSGHGTAMAALIVGDPETSNTAYHGIAPGAKLAFTDISSSADGNFTGPVDIIAYMQKARETYQSSIIVGAFGSSAPVDWYSTRDQDVDNELFVFKNLIAVFAAGNFGQTSSGANPPGKQLTSPAVAKNVISVGASQNELSSVTSFATDTNNAALQSAIAADNSQFGKNVLASFSSKGPSPDGRFKPDVVAPGLGIYTSDLTTCGLAPVQGTSFAAALVGGAAALVRQYFRAGYRKTGLPVPTDEITPSGALVKATIINSGVGLDGFSAADGLFLGTANQVPHTAYGFGRVQLNNVLYFPSTAGFDTVSLFLDATTGIPAGATRQFCFDVVGGNKNLRVTLAWTDAPGSPVAGFSLTNNLDLLLMDSTGRTYYSNGLTGFDAVNNVEQVTVQNPIAGSWVALVYGASIDDAVSPSGQPYAVVVSGNVSDPTSGCLARCPHACNQQGSCSAGVCTCNAGRFGVDCSLTACPNNCSSVDGSANGVCDPITAKCECAPQFGGVDCRLPANETTVTIIKRKKGLSNGAIAGIAVGTFFAGALLCGVLGFVAAIQYLIWKRNKHKKLIEDGKK